MNEDRDALLNAAEVDHFLDVFIAAVETLLDEPLGPCGCTDYHMADCASGPYSSARDSYESDPYDGPDDDPRQWED